MNINYNFNSLTNQPLPELDGREVLSNLTPNQVKSNKATPLLNSSGELTCPSFATSDLFIYNRQYIKHKSKLKEWEFYQVFNQKYCLQVTYGHVTYAGNACFTLIDLQTGIRHVTSVFRLFCSRGMALPTTSGHIHNLQFYNKKLSLFISNAKDSRSITCSDSSNATAEFVLNNSGDAMCYCIPFKKKLFYYNYKRLFDIKSIKVSLEGKDIDFSQAIALVDSGRGCWPYRHEWLWGMASGKSGEQTIGLNIGYGNSDLGQTNENMLFVDGVAHKLGGITITHELDYNKDWQITSYDDSVSLIFKPFFDNATQTNLLVVHNRCHQVFGHYFGRIVVDGLVVQLNNVLGFCEHANNRW
ncbi:MAG: DUF2804 domain-containing protein [Clostridia bacterium]